MNNLLQAQDNKIRMESEYLGKLRNLRTGLMQDLLTSKKRVTHLLDNTSGDSAYENI